ncbi:MAG: HEAT repeat domain-containing protein [bacterium]
MNVEPLVAVLLPVLGALVAVTLVVIFAHAIGLHFAMRARARVMEPALQTALSALTRQHLANADVALVARLSRRRQIRLFVDLAPSLSGVDQALLTSLAAQLGLIATAVRLCRSRVWWRRLEGARLLILCNNSAVDAPLLLRDDHPLVRAAGAELIGLYGAPGDLERVIPLLRDEAEICRFAAKDALMRGGPGADVVVYAHLASDDALTAESLLQVAAVLGGHRFTAVALARSHDDTARVRLLAARLLGSIGSASATDRLVELLADPVPEVRWSSATALASLVHWPAASAVAALLVDDEWEVRRRAAIALWRLGAPGQLLLRRARRGENPLAAHAARQALDFATIRRAPAT